MKTSLTYFSGTGNTAYIANHLHKRLPQASLFNIETDNTKEAVDGYELIYLLYVVHAFDAPWIVHDWLDTLRVSNNQKFVVISVSGGGEVWPNTGCRKLVERKLINKGYDVVQSEMMVMPSNWLVETNLDAAVWLLRSVDLKLEQLIQNLDLNHKEISKKTSKIQQFITNSHKNQVKSYSKHYKISSDCNACGWCVAHCPTHNISFDQEQSIVFDHRCLLCFRCIYGCPKDAIHLKSLQVLNNGYDLKKYEEKLQQPLKSIEKCTKGLLWIGVKKYLREIYEDEIKKQSDG